EGLAHAALKIDLWREPGQRAEPADVGTAPRRRSRRGRPALDRGREFGEAEHDVDQAFDGDLLGVVADVNDLTGGLRGRHESRHRLDGVGDVAEGAALLEAVDLEGIFSGQSADAELGHDVVEAHAWPVDVVEPPHDVRDATGPGPVDHRSLAEDLAGRVR